MIWSKEGNLWAIAPSERAGAGKAVALIKTLLDLAAAIDAFNTTQILKVHRPAYAGVQSDTIVANRQSIVHRLAPFGHHLANMAFKHRHTLIRLASDRLTKPSNTTE